MNPDVDDLEPSTLARIRAWLGICEQRGYNVRVISVFRSFAEQDALYAQGRTAPGPRVTNAKGGQSFHNVRRAIDFGVYLGGVLSQDPDVYRQVGKAGEDAGLEWGGRWTGFPDEDHLQNRVCLVHGGHVHATDFREDGTCKDLPAQGVNSRPA